MWHLAVGAMLLLNVAGQSSDNLVGTPSPPLSGTSTAVVSSTGTAVRPGSSSTYTETGVPTGTPIPGNYTGSLRPQVHYSPPRDFMNDPNGMFVDANGTWHLYYQCLFLAALGRVTKTDHLKTTPREQSLAISTGAMQHHKTCMSLYYRWTLG